MGRRKYKTWLELDTWYPKKSPTPQNKYKMYYGPLTQISKKPITKFAPALKHKYSSNTKSDWMDTTALRKGW